MIDDLGTRLRAVCDMSVADVRGGAGRHEYDGLIQDVSPAGIAAGLARLGGEPLDDELDTRHLEAFEALAFEESRWWDPEEFLAETGPTVPPRLREFLPAIIAGDRPDPPIDITPP